MKWIKKLILNRHRDDEPDPIPLAAERARRQAQELRNVVEQLRQAHDIRKAN